MTRTGSPHVLLDLTHRGEDFIRERFPRIYQTCLRHGVNIGLQAAPVAPAAHYAMGGVRTDLDGRTNVPRLFAAGEAACTGVHGANRLASNSLLEGVVFGIRAGRAMREAAARAGRGAGGRARAPVDRSTRSLRCGASPGRNAALCASAEGLTEGIAQLEALCPQSPEERNVRQVALLIARCALAREESRGAQFRTDFPLKSDAFARHSVIRLGGDVTFR